MQKLIYTLYERLTSVNIDTMSVGGGVVLAPAIVFIERYIFSDWHFAFMLSIVVALDTALGFYKAWRRNTVSSKAFARLLNKLVVYLVLLICVHAAANLEANGKPVTLLSWLDGAVYSAILIREILSILEKAGALGVAVPTWLLKRLRDFDETGKFTDTPK